MRGSDYLEVTTFLDDLNSEASLRTRIGRSYYAAYLGARAWCEVHLGYERLRLGREHSEVPALLSKIDSDIADNLAFLRTYRNTADYDLGVSVDTLLAQFENARDRTREVISRLEGLVPLASADGDPDEDLP
jgi:hypothetical protein